MRYFFDTKNLKSELFTYKSAPIIINFFLAFWTWTGVRFLGKVEFPISDNKCGIQQNCSGREKV